MKSSVALVALASVVGVGLVIGASNLACQSSDDPVDYGKAGSGGSPLEAGTGGSAGGEEGGADTGTEAGGLCNRGQDRTIKEIATGVVGPKTLVHFAGVATTPAILAYTNKTKGTCLWAVFIKDPAEPYATMVISYGENASTTGGGVGECPAVSTSGLFADEPIQPGDVLEVDGLTGTYVPASCSDGGIPPASQIQVVIDQEKDQVCRMQRTSKSTGAPLPTTVTDLTGIMQGRPEFQSMYVKIENVDAEDWPGGGSVDKYGAIRLKGSGLEIHDKFYYKATKAPQFGSSQHFSSITGLVHLDYCSWVIQPLNKCTDYDPASLDCPDGGT